MSLSAYATAVANRARGALTLWLEIEGLPYAYGNVSKDSSWFTPRAAAARFDGIRSWFAQGQLPSIPSQELDHLEGAVGGGALTVQIVDVDGSLTGLTAAARTDGRAVFQSDLDVGVTGIRGVTGDTSTWDASGVAYVGWETFGYSGKTSSNVTISARGLYRSRDVLHGGGVVDQVTASNGSDRIDVGEIITPYPTKLEGRRVWLMAGHAPAADADCTEVWSGVIEEVGFGGADLRTLALSCSQSFGELNRPLFTDLGTFGTDAQEGEPSRWRIYSRTQPGGARSFTDPETYSFGAHPPRVATTTEPNAAAKRRHLIADGSHILRLGSAFTTVSSISVSSASIRFVPSDGDFNLGGINGSEVRECVFIQEGVEPFSQGAHPLKVLLQVLLSDTGSGDNGTWDTLPSRFGLGLAADRVDVAGISEQIEATPDLRVRLVVTEPVEKAGDWIRENLLKPFGFFLRPSLGNLLSVGRMESATPDQLTAAVTITTADIVSIGNWRSDAMSVVGSVKWLYDYGLNADGEFESRDHVNVAMQRDGRFIGIDFPKARQIEIDGGSIAAERSGGARENLVMRIATRFSQPVALLDLTLNFKHIIREVGDFVRLTLDVVPSRYTATRGVSAQLWEVVGKAVSLRDATVTLTLRQTAVADVNTRYLAPAMLVSGAPVGSDVTIDQTAYVASGQDATDAFAVGDFVRVYDPADLYDRTTHRTINGITGAVVTLDSAAGISDGMVIIHDDYNAFDIAGGASVANLAFRSPPTLTLTDSGAVTADAHEMS